MCVAKPKLLGIDYAAKAAPVVEDLRRLAKLGTDDEKRLARAKLKSLTTFELRGRTNPLTAGDPVAKDRWPRDLVRDYGADIPNVFRFELADRWRGYQRSLGNRVEYESGFCTCGTIARTASRVDIRECS